MDKDRQIRFLYPPFFFLASLLWGLYLDPAKSLSDFIPAAGSSVKTDALITTIIGGGVAILVLGFLIGTITVSGLRFGFFLFARRHFEVVVSKAAFERIRQQVIPSLTPLDRRQRFCSAVTFDHELISKGVHQWLIRRWSAFHVSANSVVALILAPIAGSHLNISVGCDWGWTTAIICIILLINAILAWRETMNMIDFQSHRQQAKHTQRDNDTADSDDDK